MTYRGQVIGGKVILPPEANLPDGTEVRVEPLQRPRGKNPLTKMLLEIAGDMKGLPEDLAEQHDHYLYGTPKR
ncbi:MAG: hypothetical protein FJ279_25290 [Planctomycetes bacterium]|nr:hypothetical protein [Planctomycetota bacterium]MBM4078187.1 hypothetical protein [Planctomycetota bacterium]